MPQPAESTLPQEPIDATEVYLTQTIVGGACSLTLGRRLSRRQLRMAGIDYTPAIGLRLNEPFLQEWTSTAWRYADVPLHPVRRKPSSLRLWFERHALRLALGGTALGIMGAAALVWQGLHSGWSIAL